MAYYVRTDTNDSHFFRPWRNRP